MTIKYHVKIVNIDIYYLVDSIKSMHQVISRLVSMEVSRISSLLLRPNEP